MTWEKLPNCKLGQGDCLELMKGIPEGMVDLTVTSPPYDNLRTYNGTLEWGEHVWKPVLESLFRVTKVGGVVVWVVNDATIKGSETGTSFRQALYAKEIGFNLHDTMIWHKPNPIPRTHNRYEQAFEFMFVFAKESPKAWNPIKVPSKLAGKKRTGTIQKDASGKRSEKNLGGCVAATKPAAKVWSMVNGEKSEHPAVFPLALAQDHLLSWSNENDVILDPFLGSGTTGAACVNLNRRFIGIEKDATYFAIAKDRIQKAIDAKASTKSEETPDAV
jgi:DNA modification methylase